MSRFSFLSNLTKLSIGCIFIFVVSCAQFKPSPFANLNQIVYSIILPTLRFNTNQSDLASATITPTPAGGTYAQSQSVTLSTTLSGATIRYVLQTGSQTISASSVTDPNCSSTQYSAPISISTSNAVLKSVLCKDGATGRVRTDSYSISGSGASQSPSVFVGDLNSDYPINADTTIDTTGLRMSGSFSGGWVCVSTSATPACGSSSNTCSTGTLLSTTTNFSSPSTVRFIGCQTSSSSSIRTVTLTNSNPSFRRIFVSKQTVNGSVSTPTADAMCLTDANNPDTTKRWKVFRTGGSGGFLTENSRTTRTGNSPYNGINWIMDASTTYRRPTGEVIGTTNANNDFRNVTFTNPVHPTRTDFFLTGFKASPNDYTYNYMDNPSTDCGTWASSLNSSTATVGQVSATTGNALANTGTTRTCDTQLPLVCVEQSQNLRIYVTALNVSADFFSTSIDRGDGIACNNDNNKPQLGWYRVLAYSATGRTIGCNSSWPIRASTQYYQTNGTTLVGTSNASCTFTLPMLANIDSGNNAFFGMVAATWTTSNNCSDFTSTLASNTNASVLTGPAATNVFSPTVPANTSCGVTLRAICVEKF